MMKSKLKKTLSILLCSTFLAGGIGSAALSDQSELEQVENIKGNETYTMNGDNMRVWDAQGNDIYYQGNIEKELPVELAVSYQLNGKSISPAELAGKSGRVTIRFDYKNNQYETVAIDGKEEKIYVPFVMLTGMLLDNDIFTNVDVSNGKLINDGSRTVVIGMALPGLQTNLNISPEKFEIPDYVEIRADVKNFKMTNTITIATNEIFQDFDTQSLNSIDEFTNSMNQLTDAMNQLMDGSSQLYDGLCTLLEKSKELISGIDQLAEGSEKLKNGAKELDLGAADLADGAKTLADGLGQLSSNNDTLNAGSRQVAKQAKELARQKVTSAVLAQKDTIREKVTAAVKEEVIAKVTEAVRSNVTSTVLATQNLTQEQYEAGIQAGVITAGQQAQMEAAIRAQMETDTIKAMIDANTNVQIKSSDIQNTITQKTEEQTSLLIEQNMNSAEVQGQITAALEQAKSGAPALIEGISHLRDGAMKISDGLNEFYEKGISKLTDAVDGKLGSLITRIQATADVSRDYRSFSGISEEMSGKVKFIYRTDSVELK